MRRATTVRSASAAILHSRESPRRRWRATTAVGPGRPRPPDRSARASWMTTLPPTATNGLQSTQSRSQPASEWSPSMNTMSTLAAPRRGDVVRERHVPMDRRTTRPEAAPGAREQPARGALARPPASRQRVGVAAEGIDQVQLRVRPERALQGERGGALVDADLHDAPGALGCIEQHPRVVGRVHRARWDQPEADGERAQAHVVAQARRRQRAQRLREDRHAAQPTRTEPPVRAAARRARSRGRRAATGDRPGRRARDRR